MRNSQIIIKKNWLNAKRRQQIKTEKQEQMEKLNEKKSTKRNLVKTKSTPYGKQKTSRIDKKGIIRKKSNSQNPMDQKAKDEKKQGYSMGLKLHKVPEFKKSSTVVVSPGLFEENAEQPARKPSKSNTHIIGIWKNKDQVPSERLSSESVSVS